VRWATLDRSAEHELDLRMLGAFADALRQTFTLVVLDCPPVSVSPLSGVLSRITDGTIVVAAAGRTPRRAIERTVTEISRMGGQVVGLVLNRQRDWLPAWLRRRLA
jgi:Mrp family chromosome partitioning ATPase